MLQNLILLEIEKLMQVNRSSLKKFSSILYSNLFIDMLTGNRLIYAELDNDKDKERNLFESNFRTMTNNFF